MHVLFGSKTPIHALNLFPFVPLSGEQCEQISKGTSLRESASFEPSCVKICRRVWPVGEFPKKGMNNFGYISAMCPEAPMDGDAPNFAHL